MARVQADKGKHDKKPFNPVTGQLANDSRLGVSFEDALAHVNDYDGLGFYVEPPYLCIDIDDCRDPKTGKIESKALNLIYDLDTYTEVSPSGTGIHIWAKAVKPGPVCRKGKIEIYDTGRFMTLTGTHIPEFMRSVCDRDITVAYKRMLAGEFELKANQPNERTGSGEASAGNGVQIVRTQSSPFLYDNLAEKIELLMHGRIIPGSKPFVVSNDNGNISYPSQSEADLGLCTLLAIKGLDADQIDKQFRESVLYRPKWEREDYRVNHTIAKAIASAERIRPEEEKRALEPAAAESLEHDQSDESRIESTVEPESAEAQPEQTQPKKEPKIVVAFETPADVALASRLGFNAVPVTEDAEILREKYDHIALFGESAVATRLRNELDRFGNSAGFGIFPDDPNNTYKGVSGTLRCRPCKSLADASKHYTDAQLKEYLTQMLTRDFVREFNLKAPKPTGIAPRQYPLPEARSSRERIAEVLEKEDPATGKKYTVKRLVPPVAPQFDRSMFYGHAGDVALKIADGTEAHPVSVYLSLLVALGNMMGRTDQKLGSKRPHFRVKESNEFSVHYTNEFLANAGSSSQGRKGTTEAELLPLFQMIDGDWLHRRTCSGFATNQAIIYEIRDATSKKVYNRKTSEWETHVMPGVDDKRLLIQESELANLFLMARRDPRVSVTLRNGFDGKKLSNRVMGKDDEGYNQSLYCAEPHLSILGSITPKELIETIPPGSVANGFGNRFLFCYIYRTQRVPSGGPTLNWFEDAKYFIEVLGFARTAGYVGLNQGAEKVWDRMYDRLEDNPLTGTAGELTRRAAAHVRRLALMLTLIDMEKETQARHLLAAEAVWRYCQESVRFLFTGAMTRDQAQIMEYLARNPGTTRGQIRRQVFRDNKRATEVHVLVADLIDTGRLRTEGDKLFKARIT